MINWMITGARCRTRWTLIPRLILLMLGRISNQAMKWQGWLLTCDVQLWSSNVDYLLVRCSYEVARLSSVVIILQSESYAEVALWLMLDGWWIQYYCFYPLGLDRIHRIHWLVQLTHLLYEYMSFLETKNSSLQSRISSFWTPGMTWPTQPHLLHSLPGLRYHEKYYRID